MRGEKGFTLVEIMIVVAIIGLLAAVAIPNFIKAKANAQTNACISNLKQIDGAKTLWALDGGGTGEPTLGTPEAAGDLVPNYIKTQPHCPATGATGAAYVVGDYTTQPACPNVGTYTGHHL
ncbi:MAG: prepilin-type N-terminal cleavage/methylation domain-containing protein [Candidatus Omnitrophica bacterium]|nr:prepilin-type N-terminal cleavage/methylation domain-containing protein [Candidatus Omnitrophota bacterium]